MLCIIEPVTAKAIGAPNSLTAVFIHLYIDVH